MAYVKFAAVAAALLASTSAAYAAETATTGGSASITVIRPITLTNNRDIAFGTVVRPSTGSGSVALTADDTTVRSVTGGAVALASTTPTSAKFTVDGEGGQSVAVTIPPTVALSGPGALTLTTVHNLGATPSNLLLSGALGGDGSLIAYIGGSIPLTDTTATGLYTGTFNVTATYN